METEKRVEDLIITKKEKATQHNLIPLTLNYEKVTNNLRDSI